jgi:6-phosphogluconolactonase
MLFKKLINFIFMTIFLHAASARECRFYLGTYTRTQGGENEICSPGIMSGTLDLSTGKLGPLVLAAEVSNPSYLAISPHGKFLYAAIESPSHGAVAAFRIGTEGKLTFLNQQPAGGSATCHVSLDASGRYLFAANYSSGNVSCFPLSEEGVLGESSSSAQFVGSGADSKRQSQPHAHSISTDPQNRFVYACDLGTDSVWIHRFDAQHGVLLPNTPDVAKTAPGDGPRHFVFHPKCRYLYVNNEMGLSVSVFARDTDSGALTLIQEVSILSAGSSVKGATTAEIACHPSGKWLYVSERGEDKIVLFSIGEDGKLKRVASFSAGVKCPRGFAIDPTGHWLLCAGQEDHKIVVLKIDQTTGVLESTDQEASVGTPVSVLFAPVIS